jgi:hypothetical protein
MAAQAGLRLAENFGKIDDAECATPGKRQQAEPSGLGAGAQRGEEGLHALDVT